MYPVSLFGPRRAALLRGVALLLLAEYVWRHSILNIIHLSSSMIRILMQMTLRWT